MRMTHSNWWNTDLNMQFSGYTAGIERPLGWPARDSLYFELLGLCILPDCFAMLIRLETDFLIIAQTIGFIETLEASGFEPLTFSVQRRRSTN